MEDIPIPEYSPIRGLTPYNSNEEKYAEIPKMEDLDTMMNNIYMNDINENLPIEELEPEDYYDEEYITESITTREIKEFYDKGKNKFEPKAKQLQEDRELSLKDSLIKCESKVENIFDFDYDAVSKLINSQSHNPELLFELQCVLNYLFKDIGELNHQVIIRKYLKALKRIGGSSVGGYAFTTEFNDINTEKNDFIVLKTNSRKSKNSFVHELFVGLVLNYSREDIPNFVFTYGGFDCSRPIDPQTKIVSYCKRTNFNIEYIMLENIKYSTTLADFIQEGCTVEDLVMVYLQILYALYYTNKRFDFTHYDLHGENILLNFYDNPLSIPYETENEFEYLNTNIIAHIIDFGFSHIKYQNNHYGIFGFESFAKYPNTSFYLSDAYNLLCKCIEEAARANHQYLIEALDFIFAFFNHDEDAVNAVIAQRKYNHMLPPLKQFPDLSNLDLAAFIRNLPFNLDITTKAKYRVLNCKLNKKACSDMKNLIKTFKINEMEVTDFLELLHQILGMNKEEIQNAKEKNMIYVYNNLYPKHVKKLEELRNLYIEKMNNLKQNIPNISDNPDILNIDYIRQLKQFLINSIEISDIIDSYLNEYNIGFTIAEKLEIKSNESTDDPVKLFKEFINLKIKTISKIQKLSQSKLLQNIKSDKPAIAQFYLVDLDNYINLI
jgi:hypothetical protein